MQTPNKTHHNYLKIILISLSLLIVCGLVLAMSLLKFPTIQTAKAETPNYGETRIDQENGTVLVVGGEGYRAGDKFQGGSTINIYAVATEAGTNPATFIGNGSNLQWNWMVTSLNINGTIITPNKRNPLTIGSNNCGGYEVKDYNVYDGQEKTKEKETRYLIHSMQVNGAMTIRANYDYVQKYQITTYYDNTKTDSYGFTYYAYNEETLGSIIDGQKIADKITSTTLDSIQKKFIGWYSLEGTPELKTTSPQYKIQAKATDQTNTTTQNTEHPNTQKLGAIVFSVKEIYISTTTKGQSTTEKGGTAYITNTQIITEISNNEQKVFPHVSWADSINPDATNLGEQYDLKRNASIGSIQLKAIPAEGYKFLGWYKNGEQYSTNISQQLPFSSLNSGDILQARFAKTVTITTNNTLDGNYTTQNLGTTTNFIGNTSSYDDEIKITAKTIDNKLFTGFYINGEKLTQENITSLLKTTDANLTQENGEYTLTFRARENIQIEIRYQTSIEIELNLSFISQLESKTITDENFYIGENAIIVIKADNTIVQIIKTTNRAYAIVPYNSAIEITIKIKDNTNYNLNSIYYNETKVIIGENNYKENTANNYTYSFNATQSTTITANLNPKNHQVIINEGTTNTSITINPSYTVEGQINGILGYSVEFSSISGYALTNLVITINGETKNYFFSGNQTSFTQTSTELTRLINDLFNFFNTKEISHQAVLKMLTNTPSYSGTGNEDLDRILAEIQNQDTIQITTEKIYTANIISQSPDTVAQFQEAWLISASGVPTDWLMYAQNTPITIVANKQIIINSKLYVFSYFSIDGSYYAGLSQPNSAEGKTLTETETTYSIELTGNRNLTIIAVYRKAIELEFASITNSKNDNVPQISYSVYGKDNAIYGLGMELEIQATDPENFMYYLVEDNGNTTKHTNITLVIQAKEGIKITAVYCTKLNTTPNALNQGATQANGIISYGQLLYQNGKFEFTAPTAGGMQIKASQAETRHGTQVTLTAEVPKGYIFIGYYGYNAGSELSFNSEMMALSTNAVYTATITEQIQIVGLFAKAINLVVIPNVSEISGQPTTITINGLNTNTIQGYVGQNIYIETISNNFIGFYQILSENENLVLIDNNRQNSISFVLTEELTITALFGNKSLIVNQETHSGETGKNGGLISAELWDNREITRSQGINTNFAYSQTKQIKIIAEAQTGYKFLGWYNTQTNSIISTESAITLPATSNITIKAIFAKVYTFEAIIKTETGEILDSSFVYGLPSFQQIDNKYTAEITYGQQILLYATNQNNYQFEKYNIINNGTATTTTNANVTINAQGNISIEIIYVAGIQINISSTHPSTITINDEEYTSTKQIAKGTNLTLKIKMGQANLHFEYIQINGIKITNADSRLEIQDGIITYNHGEATTNLQIEIIYSNISTIITNIKTNNANSSAGGTITITQNDQIVQPDENGIIGKEYKATATANAGYKFLGYEVDGRFIPSSETNSNEFSFKLTNATSITAVFAQIYSLTITLNGNAEINKDGTAILTNNGQVQIDTYFGEEFKIEYASTGIWGLYGITLNSTSTNVITQNSISFVTSGDIDLTLEYRQTYNISVSTNTQQKAQLSYQIHGTGITISGTALKIPEGMEYQITTPLTIGTKVMVGLKSGHQTINLPWTYQTGKVISTAIATEQKTIQAIYQEYTEIYISSNDKENPSVIQTNMELLKSSLNIQLDNQQANWLIAGSEQNGQYLAIKVPNSMQISLTIDDAENELIGWFFVANPSITDPYYNINQLTRGTNAKTITFYANQLSAVTKNVYLQAGYNITIKEVGQISTLPKPTPNGEGDITIKSETTNSKTITAEPSPGNQLWGWEIQIGATYSNVWLRISQYATITISMEENETHGYVIIVKDTSGTTIYTGYAYNIRASFKNITNESISSALTEQGFEHFITAFEQGKTTIVANKDGMPGQIYYNGQPISQEQVKAIFGESAILNSNTISFVINEKEIDLEELKKLEIRNVQYYTINVDSEKGQATIADNNASGEFAEDTKITLEITGITLLKAPTGEYYYEDGGIKWEFKGWYNKKGELKYAAPIVTHVVKSNESYTARFSKYYKLEIYDESKYETIQIWQAENTPYTLRATTTNNYEFIGITILNQQNTTEPGLFISNNDGQIVQNGQEYEYTIKIQEAIKIIINYQNVRTIGLEISPAEETNVGGILTKNGEIQETTKTLYVKDGDKLLATANNGYVFAGYYALIDGAETLISLNSAITVNTRTATTIKAVFRKQVQLTILSNHAQGQAIIQGAIGLNMVATITASDIVGYKFIGWANEQDKIISNEKTIEYKFNTTNLLKMLYTNEYEVNIKAEIQSSTQIQEITIAGLTSTQRVENETQITLKAQMQYDYNNSKYLFTGWVVNGIVYSTNNAQITLKITGETTITAQYQKSKTITLPASTISNTLLGTNDGLLLQSGVKKDYSFITNTSTTTTYEITEQSNIIYAVWTPAGYEITTINISNNLETDLNNSYYLNFISGAQISSNISVGIYGTNNNQIIVLAQVNGKTEEINDTKIATEGSGNYSFNSEATISFALPDGATWGTDITMATGTTFYLFRGWYDQTGQYIGNEQTKEIEITSSNIYYAKFELYYKIETSLTKFGNVLDSTIQITDTENNEITTEYIQVGTKIRIWVESDNNSNIMGIYLMKNGVAPTQIANGNIVRPQISLPCTSLSTDYIVDESITIMGYVAELKDITITIQEGGTIGSIQITDPLQYTTIEQLTTNATEVVLKVNYGSTIIITAKSADRYDFVGYESTTTPSLNTSSAQLEINNIENNLSILAKFKESYRFKYELMYNNGELITDPDLVKIDKVENKIQLIQINGTTDNGSKLINIIYRSGNGSTEIVTETNITKLFGETAEWLNAFESVIQLKNLTIKENAKLEIIYQKSTINNSIQIELDGQNRTSSELQIFDNQNNPTTIDSLKYLETYKLSAPLYYKDPDSANTYYFIGWEINGNDYGNSTTIDFSVMSETLNIKAKYTRVYTINIDAKEQVEKTLVDSENGIVQGNGTYNGLPITISAQAKIGYKFLGWYSEDSQLISQEQTITIINLSAIPQYALFAKTYTVEITTELGGNICGSYKSDILGTYYTTELQSGTNIIANVIDGTEISIIIEAKTGYHFVGLYKADETKISAKKIAEGKYQATIKISEASEQITAKFIEETKSEIVIETEYETAPTTPGKVEYSTNQTNWEEITTQTTQLTLQGITKLYLRITLPQSETKEYGIEGVYQSGEIIVPAQNTGIVSTYIISNVQDGRITIKFAEYKTIKFTATYESGIAPDSTDTVKHTSSININNKNIATLTSGEETDIKVFLGQVLHLTSSNSKSVEFKQYDIKLTTGADYNTNTQSIQLTTNDLEEIKVTFKEVTKIITIYFPKTIRNYTTKSEYAKQEAPALSMYIYVEDKLYATITGDTPEDKTVPNTISIQEDNVIINFPRGYSKSVKVYFGTEKDNIIQSTNRTLVYLDGNQISGNSMIPESIILIDSNQALSHSKTIIPQYINQVLIEVTHNSNDINQENVTLSYNNLEFTTQLDYSPEAQIIKQWIPVGTRLILSVSDPNQNFSSFAFTKQGVLHDQSIIQKWTDETNRPENWQGIPAQGQRQSKKDYSLFATSDMGIIADFQNVWTIIDQKRVYTIGRNEISTEKTALTELNKETAIHGNQVFEYIIDYTDSLITKGYYQDNSTTFKEINESLSLAFASNGTIINGIINIISIKDTIITYQINNILKTAKYRNAPLLISADDNSSGFLVTGVINNIIMGVYVSTEENYGQSPEEQNKTDNYKIEINGVVYYPANTNIITKESTTLAEPGSATTTQVIGKKQENHGLLGSEEIIVPSAQVSQNTSEEKPIGQTLLNLQAKTKRQHTFVGFLIVTGTKTTININPNTDLIYQEIEIDGSMSIEKNSNFDFENYIFISNQTTITIPVQGNLEIYAIYEKDLYIISSKKYSVYKTNDIGEATINGNIISIKTDNENDYTIEETIQNEQGSVKSKIVAVEKLHESYLIYTNLVSNNGTIKGSLVYEAGTTTNINASVYHYGEFSGYNVTGLSSEVTGVLSSNEINTNYTISDDKIIPANRNPNSPYIPYSKQELRFEINEDLNLIAYFSTLRYEVTIQFAELKNESNISDTEVLFTDSKNSNSGYNTITKKGYGKINKEWLILRDPSRYLSDDQSTIKQDLINIINDNDETISYRLIKEDNGLSLKFYVDAKSGSGFAGYKITFNKNNFDLVSDVQAYFPEEDSEYLTVSQIPNYTSSGVNSKECSISINYNNQIGSGETELEANEYTTYLSNPTIYFAIKTPTTKVNIDETSQSNSIVIKNANKYYTSISNSDEYKNFINYLGDAANIRIDNWTIEEAKQAVNNLKIPNENERNENERKAIAQSILKYLTALNTAKMSFSVIDNIYANPGIQSITNDSKNELTISEFKVQLSNNRQLKLSYKNGSFKIDSNTIDGMKYEVASYNKETGQITLTNKSPENGANPKETYSLIICAELSVSKSIEGIEFKNNQVETVVTYNFEYHKGFKSETIHLDQDDILISETEVTSKYVPEKLYPEDWANRFFLFGRPKSGERAYDYFSNTTLSFKGIDATKSTDYFFPNSGSSSVKRNTTARAITQWSIWDTYYNAYFEDTIREVAIDNNPQTQGNGRYSTNLYAFVANDANTLKANTSTNIILQRTEDDNDRIVLNQYPLSQKTWEETWGAFVAGAIYGIMGVILAGTILSGGLALGPLLLAASVIAATSTVGSLLDDQISQAINEAHTRLDSVESRQSYQIKTYVQLALSKYLNQ